MKKNNDESELIKRINEEKYYEIFQKKGIRPDGRKFSEMRNITIKKGNISTSSGSSLVRIGKTTVICAIEIKTEIPSLNKPDEGKLFFNTLLPKIASSRFDSRDYRDELFYDVSNYVEEHVRKIIDLKQLCIESGKAVFVLKINTSALIYDGNLVDSFFLAVLSALEDLKIPPVKNDETEKKVIEIPGDYKKLKIAYYPISISFCMIKGQVMIDMTEYEEKLTNTIYHIVYNEKGQLCSLDKKGGKIVKQEIIISNMKLAKSIVSEIYLKIKKNDS